MKNKIMLIIMIFVSIICLNSCKEKEFELYKYDGTEFTLEKSIDVLEKMVGKEMKIHIRKNPYL